MRFEKKVLAKLSKCYSLAEISINGEPGILVASEKQAPCYLFDIEGNKKATVWEGPGGVMSIVPLPWGNGSFLATHEFYSPNDASDARIVLATAESTGQWSVKTLVSLPFIHRFDILESNGFNYLIACTVKSEPEPKDAWKTPGKIFTAELPQDLSRFNDQYQLPLQILRNDLFKNHGYYRVVKDGVPGCLISSEQGVLYLAPPTQPGEKWREEQLLSEPSSDALLLDLDGDGEQELVVFQPFHGDVFKIYKLRFGKYAPVYGLEEPAPFLHALYGGPLCGRQTVIFGHRQGKRNLTALYYDSQERSYKTDVIDYNCGSANVLCRKNGNTDYIFSANREIDQVAMYTVYPE